MRKRGDIITKYNLVSWMGSWNRKKKKRTLGKNQENLNKLCSLVNVIIGSLIFNEGLTLMENVNNRIK